MAHDYSVYDPKGWGGDPRRGAALGRPIITRTPRETTIKLHVQKVRINSGGYDRNGTYFGVGGSLYWIYSDDGDVDFVVRAHDRDYARSEARYRYPYARFYR